MRSLRAGPTESVTHWRGSTATTAGERGTMTHKKSKKEGDGGAGGFGGLKQQTGGLLSACSLCKFPRKKGNKICCGSHSRRSGIMRCSHWLMHVGGTKNIQQWNCTYTGMNEPCKIERAELGHLTTCMQVLYNSRLTDLRYIVSPPSPPRPPQKVFPRLDLLRRDEEQPFEREKSD